MIFIVSPLPKHEGGAQEQVYGVGAGAVISGGTPGWSSYVNKGSSAHRGLRTAQHAYFWDV